MCSNCHADTHELWAIGPPYPQWEAVAVGNFVELERCQECGALWLESYYEPFAAFRYAVKWPADVAAFEVLRDRDSSLTLSKWHEAQVRLKGTTADESTLVKIRAHYERSRGYVDLSPMAAPNPIDILAILSADPSAQDLRSEN